MRSNTKKAIMLLSKCLPKKVHDKEVIDTDTGKAVLLYGKDREIIYNINEEIHKKDQQIIDKYYSYVNNGEDENAIIELIRLTLRQSVPDFIWRQIINRQYNIGNWSVSNKLVEAQANYERRPFDPEDQFFSPDFIIIGTMKGGTTSLYDYLCRHPKIISRQPKELHFFTIYYSKGISEYRKFFSQKQEYTVIGEASPSYFDWRTPEVSKRIRTHCPNTKLILILADPIKRAISQYYHELRIKKGVPLGQDFVKEDEVITVDMIRKHIREGNDEYLKTGIYIERMPNWEKQLKDGNLLIFTQTQLANNPNKVVNSICKELNLEEIPLMLTKVKKSNVNRYPQPDKDVIDFLSEYYYKANNQLKNIYGISFS